LKERFTKEPVLAVPDLDKKLRVEVDASDYATGGVLLMEGEDRKWRPVAFLSNVVATTRHSRTNDLTTSKALQWAIK